MAREYRYISGDSHLEIDSKWWVDRVPAAHRERAPRLIRLPDGGDAWLIEGRPLREVPSDLYGGKGRDHWQPFGQNYETTPGTGPAEQRLREQDADRIDAEVLFPGASSPSMWRSISDDAAYKAVLRAYNDFLAEDYCAVAPDRLLGLGMVPWTGVDDAIAELEHCKRQGLRGVMLSAYPSGRGYPTPEDDRFWAAALDLQMPLTIHQQLDRSGERARPPFQYPAASKQVLDRIGPVRDFIVQFTKFGRLGSFNAVQMALAGVFQRFPTLHLFFAETQIGWLPFFLEQADIRYERHSRWGEELLGVPQLDRPLSQVIREHCSWGFQADRAGVELRHHIGVERLIWATDFPHQESEWPHSDQVLARNFAGVPADEVRRMVADNAIAFFHLDAAPAAQATGAASAATR
ncbi:MAG TPA: amidohydrolase family protein [Chloroflexota bacterium]|nr:amidohydrolase family protein [Chloroflexota bacterium]